MPTNSQIQIIQTLITKTGNRDIKEEIILGFTEGRSKSIKDLSEKATKDLIKHLKELDPDERSADTMRKKIISMAHELNWRLPLEAGKAPRVDMRRLDAWLQKYSYLHKKLDSYTYDELPKLVTQFESVYQKFLASL
jgi:hypothetical protein